MTRFVTGGLAMRVRALFTASAIFALFCVEGFSATLAGAGMRDAAALGSIEKWSVGVNAEWMKRDLKITGGAVTKLDARVLEFFAGYDLMDWLMVFGTAGGSQVRTSSFDRYGDGNVKASLGLQGNLWQTDIMDPEFMIGNLTLKTIAEISFYQIDEKDSGLKGDWFDFSLALPFCYEIFADKPDNNAQIPYSLAILAGPVFSAVNGSVRERSGATRNLRGEKSFGLLGGVDVYFSHNLSLGCHVEYIDYASVCGSMTYHF